MNLKLLAAVLLSSFGAVGAAPLDLSLDFNDNAIPAGWTIRPGPLNVNSNYGVANGRFYAAQVDSSAFLSLAYEPSAGITALDIQWQGSVFQTFFGANEGVDVVDSTLRRFENRTESSAFNYGNGIRVFNGYATDPFTPPQQFPVGDYLFHVHYVDGSVRFTGALNGIQIFDSISVQPSFLLANLRAIELVTYETVGPESWMDNVTIKETVSAVPEPSTLENLSIGLACLFAARAMLGRRRNPLRSVRSV